MDVTREAPAWRGVNHLALVTPDMDATVRFWHGVLGARAGRHDRHAGVPALLLRRRPAATRSRSSSTPASTWTRTRSRPASRTTKASQFDHLSLNLPDEDALLRLRDRLKSHDCEVTDVVDHGFIRSIYFSDPHGMALEASWWTARRHRPAGRTRRRAPVLRRGTRCRRSPNCASPARSTTPSRPNSSRDHRGHLPHRRLTPRCTAPSRSCSPTLPRARPTACGCAPTTSS